MLCEKTITTQLQPDGLEDHPEVEPKPQPLDATDDSEADLKRKEYLAKEREWYRLRQLRLGRTVTPKFGKEPMTPEQIKESAKAAQHRYENTHRGRRRKQWRDFVNGKKARLRQFNPEEYARVISKKRDYDRAYRSREKEKRRKWNEEYVRRNKENINFILRLRLRARVRGAVTKAATTKASKTLELIGCTVDFLREHLEARFTDGMNWDRFLAGDIHIDHIKPCRRFDLLDPEQQRECFSWRNLQPLWAPDNYAKGDKYPLTPSHPLL